MCKAGSEAPLTEQAKDSAVDLDLRLLFVGQG